VELFASEVGNAPDVIFVYHWEMNTPKGIKLCPSHTPNGASLELSVMTLWAIETVILVVPCRGTQLVNFNSPLKTADRLLAPT
jgi:hypothetical protein